MSVVFACACLCACQGPDYSAAGSGRGLPDPEPAADEDGDGEPDLTPEEEMELTGDADGDGYVDFPGAVSGEIGPEWQSRLDEREPDYGQALRSASLRLRGELPTLEEILFLDRAPDAAIEYDRQIQNMLEDPRFTREIRTFFRDTFKMGSDELLDTAPTFAAQLVVEDRSMNELFTATTGTCPTWDATTGVFTPADCMNGVPAHAGLLTQPAVMKHFYSNLAFRRVRWIQETFVCSPMPAETGEPVDIDGVEGGPAYTSPWEFNTIAGAATGGRIDFLDTSSVVCANCHTTMNHIAPLFGSFDAEGQLQPTISVPLPLDGNPMVELSDWLPPGQTTHWRLGLPAADLPELGRRIAADPSVARCTITRFWNWAMGKGDVITSMTVVPAEVTQPIVDEYVASGHHARVALHAIFTSDDFVRF
jgi:hypothetical protein